MLVVGNGVLVASLRTPHNSRASRWTYIRVGPARPQESFGLACADIDGDGRVDIIGVNWIAPNNPVEFSRNRLDPKPRVHGK